MYSKSMNWLDWYDFGYPLDGEQDHLALYEPASDILMFTHGNLELIRQLKLIMSSRYSLYLCKINQATNYRKNLIDNQCCYNWTIRNKSFNLIESYMDADPIIVDELLPATNLNHRDFDIFIEQHWMQSAVKWIKFIQFWKKIYKWYTVENFLLEIFENEDLVVNSGAAEINKFEKILKKSFYLNRDIETAEQEIQKYVQDNEELLKLYGFYAPKDFIF